MRWRRRARLRRQAELDELKERLLFSLLLTLPSSLQVAAVVHQQLMEALAPMAQALQRQDELLLQETENLQEQLWQGMANLQDLLKEVLNSLQPPVERQLLPSTPPSSSLSSRT